jgi:hypothetical protein
VSFEHLQLRHRYTQYKITFITDKHIITNMIFCRISCARGIDIDSINFIIVGKTFDSIFNETSEKKIQ